MQRMRSIRSRSLPSPRSDLTRRGSLGPGLRLRRIARPYQLKGAEGYQVSHRQVKEHPEVQGLSAAFLGRGRYSAIDTAKAPRILARAAGDL